MLMLHCPQQARPIRARPIDVSWLERPSRSRGEVISADPMFARTTRCAWARPVSARTILLAQQRIERHDDAPAVDPVLELDLRPSPDPYRRPLLPVESQRPARDGMADDPLVARQPEAPQRRRRPGVAP